MSIRCRFIVVSLIAFVFGAGLHASTRLDGTPDSSYTGAAGAYPQVGAMLYTGSDGLDYICSGTAITNEWVLTAAHCVEGASNIQFLLGPSVIPKEGEVAPVSKLAEPGTAIAHPDWNGSLAKGNDIGLFRLATPINHISITPATFYEGGDERGLVGTSVGYGLTGLGSEQGEDKRYADGYTKRVNVNDIDFHWQTRGKENKYFGFDFDDGSNGNNEWGDRVPNPLEGGTLFGDSGGPVFLNGGEIAGINSFISAPDGLADADYGDLSGHTRVSLYVDWINSTIGSTSGGGGGGGDTGGGGGGNGKGNGRGRNKNNAIASLEGGQLLALVGSLGPVATTSSVPEPSSAILLTSTCLMLLGNRRRRR